MFVVCLHRLEISHFISHTEPTKYSSGVKSHDLGGQLISPPRKMTKPSILLFNKLKCFSCYMTIAAVLLEPRVWEIHTINLDQKEIVIFVDIGHYMDGHERHKLYVTHG